MPLKCIMIFMPFISFMQVGVSDDSFYCHTRSLQGGTGEIMQNQKTQCTRVESYVERHTRSCTSRSWLSLHRFARLGFRQFPCLVGLLES